MKKLALKPLTRLDRNSRILDIGSGNNCLDISTHLIDLMPESNAERPADLERPAAKEFKIGSIEAIPFSDGFFNFVHAAHVLEHVEVPAKALSELMRVAPAGYIETPAASTEQGSILSETKTGWDFHRWYVWSFPEMDCLRLKPKTQSNLFRYCDCRYGKAFSRLLGFVKFQDLDPVLPYHCKMMQFNWSGTIRYEIWGEDQQGRREARHGCTCMYAAFFAHTKMYFRNWFQIRRRRDLKARFPEAYRILRSNGQSDF